VGNLVAYFSQFLVNLFGKFPVLGADARHCLRAQANPNLRRRPHGEYQEEVIITPKTIGTLSLKAQQDAFVESGMERGGARTNAVTRKLNNQVTISRKNGLLGGGVNGKIATGVEFSTRTRNITKNAMVSSSMGQQGRF
jgi:hypothetical protein